MKIHKTEKLSKYHRHLKLVFEYSHHSLMYSEIVIEQASSLPTVWMRHCRKHQRTRCRRVSVRVSVSFSPTLQCYFGAEADPGAFPGHLIHDEKCSETSHTHEITLNTASAMALSHRKPPIHEDFRLHVLDSGLVAGVNSAIGPRMFYPRSRRKKEDVRLGVIVWGGEGLVVLSMMSLKHLRQEHCTVSIPPVPCLFQP